MLIISKTGVCSNLRIPGEYDYYGSMGDDLKIEDSEGDIKWPTGETYKGGVKEGTLHGKGNLIW
jgi:hypothetical protein